MTDRPGGRKEVAVVVASVDAAATARESLGRFVEEAGGRGEVVLVDASLDGTADLVMAAVPGVRVLRREPGALVPELWRDGLLATEAPLVAFSTAAMTPSRGWLDALLARLDETGAATVGGPIVPAAGLPPIDRAVYLVRYVRYLGPLPEGIGLAPPGENALYRRDRLGGLESTLARGFWEAEIQRRLCARGEHLAMAHAAPVTYHGGCGLAAALHQRFRHARHYGATRAERWNLAERLARSAAAPLVPAVLLGRAVAELRRRGRPVVAWVPAFPALTALLAAWALGEAVGTVWGPERAAGASGQPQWEMRWMA